MLFEDWLLAQEGKPYRSPAMLARAAWQEATQIEREFCAVTCEIQDPVKGTDPVYECAAAIRKRGSV